MTNSSTRPWEPKRTDETRQVEAVLEAAGFDQVDAYRYNSASIRIRVIDARFEGLSTEKRDGMIEPVLDQLPERTQADIVNLFAFAPSEVEQSPETSRAFLLNTEFVDPSPSML